MKKEKKKNIFKTTLKFIILFIILLSIFCISMIISYALPNERIQGHIKESENSITYLSNNMMMLGNNIKGAEMDKFTDILILNTSMNKGKYAGESIFSKAFGNSRYSNEGEDQLLSFQQTVNDENLQNNQEYARYWHGIQTIIRPLLLFFNYEEICYIFIILTFILMAYAIYGISKNLNYIYGIAFLISMLIVCFFVAPFSIQYTGMFMAMLIMIILVNYLYKTKKEYLYPYLFFIAGGCATFFDLLTVPVLTLGMPLVMVILLKTKEGTNIKDIIIEMIKLSFLWGIAYATLWASKWIIASIILHRNVITEALECILFRTNGNEQYPATRLGAIRENLSYIFNSVTILVYISIFVIWIIALIRKRKNIKDMKSIIPLILVALYPYAWYFAFAGHSTIHAWFTYRSQAIAIFAILCAMIETIKIEKGE